MSQPTPVLSVIIPAYNRPEPLKYTLRSVARAAAMLAEAVEVLVVDDGSEPPIVEQLRGFDARIPLRHLRQVNQGSIVARLTGLQAALGEFVQWLDSDDLVAPAKFREQVATLRREKADVVYADMATARLANPYDVAAFSPAAVTPTTAAPAELFIKIQPAPHNPLYRRDYLLRALAPPLVAPGRSMDPSGDVWLYYNLAAQPARIARIDGPFAAPGPHEEDRYSQHWEKLGLASLEIMEAFLQACPETEATRAARIATGEMAFRTWRGLPRDFSAEFERRVLALWRRAPRGPLSRLGAPGFVFAARFLGPERVARLVRAYRAKPYHTVRTLNDEAYARLLGTPHAR